MAVLQCRKRGGFSINGNLQLLISDGRSCRSDAVTADEWSRGHGEVSGWVRSMVGWSSVDGCTAAAMPAKAGTRLRMMMHFGTVLWQPARVRAHAAHVCDPSRQLVPSACHSFFFAAGCSGFRSKWQADYLQPT
ncbi:hypothetical protein ACLOJK_009915 [Asimina triloba]